MAAGCDNGDYTFPCAYIAKRDSLAPRQHSYRTFGSRSEQFQKEDFQMAELPTIVSRVVALTITTPGVPYQIENDFPKRRRTASVKK